MPVTTSAGAGQPVSPAAARLADVNGLIDPAQPQDAKRRLAAGAFVWVDLENPGDRGLRAFSESLGMNDAALHALTAVSQRPSFDVAGDSIRAMVPSSNWGRDTGDILGVQVMFTERFLLTTHSAPCRALAGVQRGWNDLPHDVKANSRRCCFSSSTSSSAASSRTWWNWTASSTRSSLRCSAPRHPVWTANSSGSAASCPRLSRPSGGTSAIFITSRAPASCQA
jgi:CorA-like Mg2+ transporter protein